MDSRFHSHPQFLQQSFHCDLSARYIILNSSGCLRWASTWKSRLVTRIFVPFIPSFKQLMLYLVVIIFSWNISMCDCRPTSSSFSKISNTRISPATFSRVVDFLIKFGYLSKNLQSSALRSEELLHDSIKQMQKFGNIPQSGILDEATIGLLRRKRCGLPDVIPTKNERRRIKRYSLHGSKWDKMDLSWSIKDWPKNLSPNDLRSELKRALTVWSDVSNLTFQETRRADADILISFLSGPHGDEFDFDGKGNVLAHAFFPDKGIGGDVHFDADENWGKSKGNSNKPSSDINLFGVAAHEFGHSLGLSHSSVVGALMFPYYQIIKDDFKLPYDDTVAIQQLYGAKGGTGWAPYTPGEVPSAPTETSVGPSQPRNPDYTPRPRTTQTPESVPEMCSANFDAISSIRGEIFAFKGKHFWRLDSQRNLDRTYPIEVNRFWYKVSENVDKIDAIYERPTDKKIVFFIGSEYFVYSGNHPDPGYPRPLTNLGLPRTVTKLDAAMVWAHNGKTYFFSKNQYWRFDELEQRVELDYPRDMAIWKGVPYNIDSAFTLPENGVTYFFKGDFFWTFENRKMTVTSDSPKPLASYWFHKHCKDSSRRMPKVGFRDEESADDNATSGGQSSLNFQSCLFSFFTILYSFYNLYKS